MALPTLSPQEATPLDASRKRKRSDAAANIEQVPGGGGGGAAEHQAPAPPADRQQGQDDQLSQAADGDHNTDDASDTDSMINDIVDSFQLEPYIPDDEDGISEEEIKVIRAALRRDGPQKFWNDHVSGADAPVRKLAVAFGINPHMGIDDDIFFRLLGSAILHFYRKRQKLDEYNTIDDAAQLLRQAKKIVVLTGAGISTSLGIPDFRSKSTGFYAKLRAQGFTEAEEVFDIEHFDAQPQDFYGLAADILPDMNRCTPTHQFIRLLQDHNRLLTNYTQNIDNLETVAGIQRDKVIQCHGSFATASCRKCKHQVPGEAIYDHIRKKRIAYCKQKGCGQTTAPVKPSKKAKSRHSDFSDDDDDDDVCEPGVMKPDITFFGEKLPTEFFERLSDKDSKEVDLVIVIGTSLKVAPVSEIPNYFPHHVPHIYVSREDIKHVSFDIQLLGDCDDVVVELCRRAGWTLEHEMVRPTVQYEVTPSGQGHVWNVAPRRPAIQ